MVPRGTLGQGLASVRVTSTLTYGLGGQILGQSGGFGKKRCIRLRHPKTTPKRCQTASKVVPFDSPDPWLASVKVTLTLTFDLGVKFEVKPVYTAAAPQNGLRTILEFLRNGTQRYLRTRACVRQGDLDLDLWPWGSKSRSKLFIRLRHPKTDSERF